MFDGSEAVDYRAGVRDPQTRATPAGAERQRSIYTSDAERYDALINAEDCEGHIAPAIERIAPVRGASVVDVGAGTGRLARLLFARGAKVVALDRERGMIGLASRRLAEMAGARVSEQLTGVADARALPVRTDTADLACAGWVFGHFPYWRPDDWRPHVERALAEMARVTRPGGALILFETLGTAVTRPDPPSPQLAGYYRWLESEQGFTREVLQTDYRFESVEHAQQLCGFFFGAETAEWVASKRWSRVPEFTGMWWKRV